MTVRLSRLIPAVVALAASAVFTFRPTYDPDLFWHLAQGRHDVQVSLVRANLFSATYASYPQLYTSWAFEAVQATVEGSYGLLGVQVIQWGFLAAALLMLYAAARTRGSRSAAFTVLLLALFVIEPRAMPRPYVVSFVGFALSAWWVSLVPRPTSLVPVLTIGLWSNFHSESVFGVALIILGTLHDPQWPSKVKLWLACILATLATPYGFGLWRYLFENTGVPSALRIAELEPATLGAYPAFFAFLAVLALALASMPRRLKVSEILVAVFFAALGIRYIRFMPMVVFATAPMLADRIQAWIERGWDRRAVLVTAAAIMAVTASASPQRMLAAWRTGDAALAPTEYFSEAAIEFIRANGLTGKMFNSMNLGGYLDWKLGGNTFIDSRLQAVPREFFVALTEAAYNDEKWKALVKDVNWAVISLARPSDISGAGKFNAPEWISVFRDPAVEIFVRRYATLR